MDKQLLKSYMARNGDTQARLAAAMSLSLSRLNAKINETGGAEFTQSEMVFIAKRYHLTEQELCAVFFTKKVS